jgi:hypothetical protein
MKINFMLYLKLRLHAVLGHVQSSTPMSWYAEMGGTIKPTFLKHLNFHENLGLLMIVVSARRGNTHCHRWRNRIGTAAATGRKRPVNTPPPPPRGDVIALPTVTYRGHRRYYVATGNRPAERCMWGVCVVPRASECGMWSQTEDSGRQHGEFDCSTV